MSTTFTAQEAQREYPDADVSWDEWCQDIDRQVRLRNAYGLARKVFSMTEDEYEHWLAYVDQTYGYDPIGGTS